MKLPYENFEKYILRTPLLPLNLFLEFTKDVQIEDDQFKKKLKDPVVFEAIFLASPDLSSEIEKWLQGDIIDQKKIERLKLTILKYISRMSSRCTPFGLFAGCSVGHFSEKNKIELKNLKDNSRHTRLDMNYTVALSQKLANIETIRNQIVFYPNNSIYKVNEKLRYVEYTYNNGKRQNQITEVDESSYLEEILSLTKEGAKTEDLINNLTSKGIDILDAKNFIDSLIDNQILISELEPTVSGQEFMEHIIKVLRKVEGINSLKKNLYDITNKLKLIDQNLGNETQVYEAIIEDLKKFEVKIKRKHLFQSDLKIQSKTNTLKKEVVDSIKKGLVLLNKITLPQISSELIKFRDAFYSRYEEREMELSKVLDTEMGIGYSQSDDSGILSPLVDDLVIPMKSNTVSQRQIQWNSIDAIFHNKVIKAYQDNKYTIKLRESDFENLKDNWDDLPDTLSCMIELVFDEKGNQKIKFKGGGGSSAANLMARFCHGDSEIEEYVSEITSYEENLNYNKVLAEIVHLPESRVGNILMRPSFRKYEIPYLANSTKNTENQIPIEDLYISVENRNKVLLRSKKLDKEVLPRLTNAHNFSANSVPAYHFLSSLQNQNKRSGLFLNLGPFVNEYEFIPRIEYDNLILNPATWNLGKKNIQDLYDINDDDLLVERISTFKEKLRMPQFILLIEGDNELLINLNNANSIRVLLDQVKKKSKFKVTEFLHDIPGLVSSENGYFTNQIVVSFFKTNEDGDRNIT